MKLRHNEVQQHEISVIFPFFVSQCFHANHNAMDFTDEKPAGRTAGFVDGNICGKAASVADPDAPDDQIAVMVVFADFLDPAIRLVIALFVVLAPVAVVVIGLTVTTAIIAVIGAAIITASLRRAAKERAALTATMEAMISARMVVSPLGWMRPPHP
ncbi:hypothetical protein [Pararhizobium sp.]|uniref:hypothetical protein n=1 Tax=Pararhizobium sp. TaxID=1977563 RepID=UPI003D0F000B